MSQMLLNENNLLDAVEELKQNGYADDFVIEDDHFVSTITGLKVGKEDVNVTAGYRFEITENAVDTQNLFVIESPAHKTKGLLVDLLGMHAFSEKGIAKLLDIPLMTYVFDDNEQDLKYGLPKIYKSDFEANPGRYELRIGFPDFPLCPFEQSYNMLGFDKSENRYVWLVTSILKDKRLKTSKYGSL